MRATIGKALAGAGLIVLIGLAAEPPAQAQEQETAIGPQLSERLRGLLLEEMNLIQAGMERAMRGIATGDHTAVYENGRDIYRSFILKQKLTEEDRKELHSVVPPNFIALDQAFHETAHKLAAAGRDQDVELQGFYFGRLVESCTACHARYAADRFPGLRIEPATGEHHH
jgi:hypothetical protein